jgi:hypothetical protein
LAGYACNADEESSSLDAILAAIDKALAVNVNMGPPQEAVIWKFSTGHNNNRERELEQVKTEGHRGLID